jgi:hypothetical protein
MQMTAMIFSKSTVRFTIISPSYLIQDLKYFPTEFIKDCQVQLEPRFEYVPIEQGFAEVDIIIITAHGTNYANDIWDIRRQCKSNVLILVWFWDNHLGHRNNLSTALAADFVFPSHKYAAGYLTTPVAAMGTHVPSCCAQWTGHEAARYFKPESVFPSIHNLPAGLIA